MKTMNVLDLTPNTKFYVVDNGEIVAAKFKTAKVRTGHQLGFNADAQIKGSFSGTLVQANGKEVYLNFDNWYCYSAYPCPFVPKEHDTKIYATAEDARYERDNIMFTMTHTEFINFIHNLGYTPTIKSGDEKSYSLWFFNRDTKNYGSLGSQLTTIREIDIFKNRMMTDYHSWYATTHKGVCQYNNEVKVYNTKAECERDNDVKVVDFDDEPTEKKEPTKKVPTNIRIVYVEITR